MEDFGADRDTAVRLAALSTRLQDVPWGNANEVTEQDDWDVLSFFERIMPTDYDELLAKGMIVADHAGDSDRWTVLEMMMTANVVERGYLTLMDEAEYGRLQVHFGDVAAESIRQRQLNEMGNPAPWQVWKFKKLTKASRAFRFVALRDMVIPIVQYHAIYEAIPLSAHQAIAIANPFAPLIDLFERGVLPDWERWRFTNMRGGDLGPIPNPLM